MRSRDWLEEGNESGLKRAWQMRSGSPSESRRRAEVEVMMASRASFQLIGRWEGPSKNAEGEVGSRGRGVRKAPSFRGPEKSEVHDVG